MVNGVKKQVPEKPTERLLHQQIAANIELRGSSPRFIAKAIHASNTS
jgi:hypothetical protein